MLMLKKWGCIKLISVKSLPFNENSLDSLEKFWMILFNSNLFSNVFYYLSLFSPMI